VATHGRLEIPFKNRNAYFKIWTFPRATKRQLPGHGFHTPDLHDVRLLQSVGKLVNLVCLDLSENKLESVPESIGSLACVTDLTLSHNFIEQLPDTLGETVVGFSARLPPSPFRYPILQ